EILCPHEIGANQVELPGAVGRIQDQLRVADRLHEILRRGVRFADLVRGIASDRNQAHASMRQQYQLLLWCQILVRNVRIFESGPGAIVEEMCQDRYNGSEQA